MKKRLLCVMLLASLFLAFASCGLAEGLGDDVVMVGANVGGGGASAAVRWEYAIVTTDARGWNVIVVSIGGENISEYTRADAFSEWTLYTVLNELGAERWQPTVVFQDIILNNVISGQRIILKRPVQ